MLQTVRGLPAPAGRVCGLWLWPSPWAEPLANKWVWLLLLVGLGPTMAATETGAVLATPVPVLSAGAPYHTPAPTAPPHSQSLHIRNTGTHPAELVCARKTPARPRPPQPEVEATTVPSDDEVTQALQSSLDKRATAVARQPVALQGQPQGWRIAVWGDSHMAAAFFSDQLLHQLSGQAQPSEASVSSRFVHAGVGHGGVRGLVRKTCLSGEWSREMAYAHADAAAAPGPGMTSLVAKQPGATLALDLRDAQGQARHSRFQLLHHGSGPNAPTGPTQLAISVDGEAENLVTLDRTTGPQALALSTNAPLSSLQIRVVSGPYRFQGLQWPPLPTSTPAPTPWPTPTALHLDLFAYPGATMAGWARSDQGYLASWFTDQSYDLALIAFGTNEGNDPSFQVAAYRDMLILALGRFRQVFPQTQCILIAPGDRGTRVLKRSAAKRQAGATKQAKANAQPGTKTGAKTNAKAGSKADVKATAKPGVKTPSQTALFKYALIHQQIGQIQAEVATQHGCQAWSMQTAMGGVGSAYAWARKNPALMAPDLLHFTPAGYRELAKLFMTDFGLTKP